ncbi:MAG: S9 family peptidase [Bacteroidetes bacterium]|nr:S9 family peptidase [Bacteroidota bacterium]
MRRILVAAAGLAISISIQAQQKDSLSPAAYERAASFLAGSVDSLVYRGSIRPNWLAGDRFWYSVRTEKGTEFVLVDPVKKKKTTPFDPVKLANALSTATGKTVNAYRLPFQQFRFTNNESAISFMVEKQRWSYLLKEDKLMADTSTAPFAVDGAMSMMRRGGGNESISPDGKKAAFIRDYNLWMRDVASKKETQLTTDGVKDFGYATDNAGWTNSDRAIVKWSPDSKKIVSFQQDERHLKDMYLVTTNVGSPQLKAWKYPLPGDKQIAMLYRVVIETDPVKVIRLQIPPDPHRSTLGDDITADGGTLADIDWNPNGSEFAFVSTSRDHKQAKLRIADAVSGAVRDVFEENVATQYESGHGGINWRYLPATQEIIWFSERDNWGHLYLYDAKTGQLKNQITKGDFLAARVLDVEEKKREITFIGMGKDPVNPYYAQVYRISFDGKNLQSLTPETGNHTVVFSPSKKFIVDTYSQPEVPPVIVLRDGKGKILLPLEKADISALQAKGWKAPKSVKLLAGDGKTDVYGLVFTPTNMRAGKKYPVINYIYPGPQGGSVRSWSFAAARGDNQSLAELGFIVVLIEGTSNPGRSKSFHDMSYGNMSLNTLDDQIAGIRQLAAQYPIDTNFVGIWGHSGGGFATATAMFKYPDFYKVGIAESGNHDNRNYEDDWGERYNGLEANVDYAAQANQLYAKNLKGKLLLAHGMLDNNVPPYNTLLVVEALEKANKDYDLIIFPNSAHGFAQYGPYMMRRRWDYFVRHLQQKEPPIDFNLDR